MKRIIVYTLLLACLSLSLACVILFLVVQVILLGPALSLDNLLFMTINAHLASALVAVRLVQYISKVLKK